MISALAFHIFFSCPALAITVTVHQFPRKLYAQAASDSGGTIWVYSPPVGNGTKGWVMPVNTGPKRVGLVEAKRRLEGVE